MSTSTSLLVIIIFTLLQYTPTFIQLWIFGCACDLSVYHFMSIKIDYWHLWKIVCCL